jgi:hypothetical protein
MLMKPNSIISILKPCLMVFIVIILLWPSADIFAQQIPKQPGNITQSTLANSLVNPASQPSCQWDYYPISGGKLQPEKLLYNDPDNTPLVNLSLGNMFKGKTTHLAANGSTDFNNDNKTDVFRTTLRTDGNLQWQYSSGGTGAWQNLAYAGNNLPVSDMQFGDFSGDDITDVFGNLYNYPNYDWVDSPNGTNSFVTLNTENIFHDRMALGDFNGDGATDVFTATSSSGSYQWAYSPSGTGALINLASSGTDPALLRFGDFNGDGKTDVFDATQQTNGSTQWEYSSGGASSYVNLASTTVPYSELQFGDFNGDGKTDVLAAEPQTNGSLQVVYWPGGLGSGVTLGTIPTPAPALRVGDFNGDGISDLMAVRCGMIGPLAFSHLQTLAQSGYSGFHTTYAADINGDGVNDIILISTCQNPNQFGVCASHHLQVATALGTTTHTYNLVSPHQLGANSLDFTYYRIFSGDLNGDNKADLAIVYTGTSSLVIYTALSNGDGTFTLGSPQTFTGAWDAYNPIVGDFNGDGKADLAFTSVCNTVALNSGSCMNGDNNSVYLATSHGASGFTMSSRQDFGSATGWGTYYAFAGDFNGDGKTDLLFNSTCQKIIDGDSSCTAGNSNYVYTALSNGSGGFNLSSLQNYGSGWTDYPVSEDLVGDVNGDGRSDLVWSSNSQAAATTHNHLVVAGFANSIGTLSLGSLQNFGSTWTGYLSLADLNHDGKADLVWNNAPIGDKDVDSYTAASSNGNGTFTGLGQGSVFTGQGYFNLPINDDFKKVSSSLMLVSTRQDSISNALFVLNSYFVSTLTVKSAAAQDGWILESAQNSKKGGTFNSTASTLNLGDDAANKQYLGILSFNTSGLPDTAVITKITLKVDNGGIVGGGNPLATFQGFMVDIKNGFFGTTALEAGDFQAAANQTLGPFSPAPVSGWYSLDLTSGKAFVNKLSSNSGFTQIRLRFKLNNNNNHIANYLSLFSGNAPLASQPQLIIQYYVP